MQIIKARNVNDALETALWRLRVEGVQRDSRNGPVIMFSGPVATEYSHPRERILWLYARDANPVFHLMESLWMLAGASNVEFLLPFNARMQEYAESDGTIHGAYGRRWRNWFTNDQLHDIVRRLRNDVRTRQAVLQMWDANEDLMADVKDRPCNTHAYFDMQDGKLNMTVCCRSNDMVWGAYGANAVHFSVLQEVLASALWADVGKYVQFSNNLHLYTEVPVAQKLFTAPPIESEDCYLRDVQPTTLIEPDESWLDFLADCEDLVYADTRKYRTQFFRTVARPLYDLYTARKAGQPAPCAIPNCDWGLAYRQWLERRGENGGE